MRRFFKLFVFSVLVCASALISAQLPAIPLGGFRQVIIHPPQYSDGAVDPMGLAPYMEDLLAKQGWVILRNQDLFRSEARQIASEAMHCSIGHDDSGFGTTASLRCSDAIGQELFFISEKGVAISASGELKAALRKVAQRLQSMRPRFDANQTVDILSRLPTVERYPLTEAALDEMAAGGKLSAAVEGLWTTTDESAYRLGIVSIDSGREFVAVVIESPRTYLWQPGMVKARLTAAADGQTFSTKWRMGDRKESTGFASLKGGTLTVTLRRDGKEETVALIKLRPTITGRPAIASNSAPALSSTGTGFISATGIVATNSHVIEAARAVELYLPLQNRTIKLELVVSDVTNDLALLRVVGDDLGNLPPVLPLVDSSDVKLGADAFVVGFPLGDMLGSNHKVTSGLVSALDGIGGDPRMFQLTAPIQPGSSGSPLFDNSGRVIGVVTSSLDDMAAVRASGQVPQNVNFATKSDYLALLLKRVRATTEPEPATKPVLVPLTELIERVRASIGQIRAYR